MKTPRPASVAVAFIYLRVSTLRQATDGVSLETQEANCRAHAERKGWKIGGVFRDEGISGKDSISKRPGMQALLAAVRETPNSVVVVYSISRLSRRQSLFCSLVDERDGEGLSVSSATEPFDNTTPSGRAMMGMISVFAQLEADMISERTKDALAEVKSRGVKLGNHGVGLLLSAETIKYIKDKYASGLYSQRELVAELNRDGVPTALGGQWRLNTLQSVLKLPNE